MGRYTPLLYWFHVSIDSEQTIFERFTEQIALSTKWREIVDVEKATLLEGVLKYLF